MQHKINKERKKKKIRNMKRNKNINVKSIEKLTQNKKKKT